MAKESKLIWGIKETDILEENESERLPDVLEQRWRRFTSTDESFRMNC